MTGSREWTVLELLRWTTAHFAERGIPSARLDAECLLAFALGADRLRLYLEFDRPVGETERAAFRELVRRRGTDRVPLAYLTGEREFWSLRLAVTPEVLSPRPETETLVSVALDLIPGREGEYRVLDLGTGSGAVALALAAERPKALLTVTDISAAALRVARSNAERHGVQQRLRFAEGSLFQPVAGECYDLVVSNPPYVAEADQAALAPELGHEPSEALFGGPDGLAVLRPLVAGLPAVLTCSGAAAVEVAPDQAEAVAGGFEAAGFGEVRIHCDLGGQSRVVAGRRAPSRGSNGAPGPANAGAGAREA